MSIEVWWPQLRQESRDWLVDNNGDVVPGDLVAEIVRAGGAITADAWWVGQSDPDGFYLSDEAIDWVETLANGEDPDPRPVDPTETR